MMRDYPPDWDQRRREVYQRDRYQCQNCERRGGRHGDHELHCHHIVPKGRGGVHDLTNLITLCKACHNAVHKPHALAPTAALAGDQSTPPSQIGSLWIHAIFLVLTLGMGNIMYLIWRLKRRSAWETEREVAEAAERETENEQLTANKYQ